jgi:hypothetical protein
MQVSKLTRARVSVLSLCLSPLCLPACLPVCLSSLVCLQAVEEKLLAEMQTLTLDQGEAVAKQAQFIIVESDLPAPQRTLSTISEGTLPADAQQSGDGGAAAAAAALDGGGAFATAQLPGGVSVFWMVWPKDSEHSCRGRDDVVLAFAAMQKQTRPRQCLRTFTYCFGLS